MLFTATDKEINSLLVTEFLLLCQISSNHFPCASHRVFQICNVAIYTKLISLHKCLNGCEVFCHPVSVVANDTHSSRVLF